LIMKPSINIIILLSSSMSISKYTSCPTPKQSDPAVPFHDP